MNIGRIIRSGRRGETVPLREPSPLRDSLDRAKRALDKPLRRVEEPPAPAPVPKPAPRRRIEA